MKAPDPIPAPVKLTESEALDAMTAIARLHHGAVNALGYFPDDLPARHAEKVGYAVLWFG
jgi:hypothetical protein